MFLWEVDAQTREFISASGEAPTRVLEGRGSPLLCTSVVFYTAVWLRRQCVLVCVVNGYMLVGMLVYMHAFVLPYCNRQSEPRTLCEQSETSASVSLSAMHRHTVGHPAHP